MKSNTRPPNFTPSGAGRRGAFRAAKRLNGIPMSEHPQVVTNTRNRQGEIVHGRDYYFSESFEGQNRGGLHIREDADGHVFLDDPTQNRGPHFNDQIGRHFDY